MQTFYLAIAAIGGYLFGSIPFGLVLVRLAGLGDIRAIGSGNIGATNVLRTGRKDLAAATLLLDAGKAGIAAAVFGLLLGTTASLVAGAAAFVGHCFPVWLKFKGGKGVATNAGVCFGLAWPLGLTYAIVWLGVLGGLRISSLAGMAAVVCAAIAAAVLEYEALVPVLALIAALVLWLHRANIGRLVKGEEPRVGARK